MFPPLMIGFAVGVSLIGTAILAAVVNVPSDYSAIVAGGSSFLSVSSVIGKPQSTSDSKFGTTTVLYPVRHE